MGDTLMEAGETSHNVMMIWIITMKMRGLSRVTTDTRMIGKAIDTKGTTSHLKYPIHHLWQIEEMITVAPPYQLTLLSINGVIHLLKSIDINMSNKTPGPIFVWTFPFLQLFHQTINNPIMVRGTINNSTTRAEAAGTTVHPLRITHQSQPAATRYLSPPVPHVWPWRNERGKSHMRGIRY